MARKKTIPITVHKDKVFKLLWDLQRTYGPHFYHDWDPDFDIKVGWVGDEDSEEYLIVYLHEDTVNAMVQKMTIEAVKARYRKD